MICAGGLEAERTGCASTARRQCYSAPVKGLSLRCRKLGSVLTSDPQGVSIPSNTLF